MEGTLQPRLLRRLRIGPRLSLAIAVPSVALLFLLSLLTWSDLSLLRDLRTYNAHTEFIAAQIDARSALQIERHEMATNTTTAPPIDTRSYDAIDQALIELGFVGGSDFLEDLEDARQLAINNRRSEATRVYNDLIHDLEDRISQNLSTAPLGIADQRSRALDALLHAQEFLLLEELEGSEPDLDLTRLNELHTSALSEIGRFAAEGSPQGVALFEQITVSNPWRELNLLRLEAVNTPAESTVIDPEPWSTNAAIRGDALAELVDFETNTLREDLDQTIQREINRLAILAALTFVILFIVSAITAALRQSIIEPISSLTLSARQIARGEPAPTTDVSPDEIGEMARVFASISGKIEHLWNDVDTVAEAVAEGNYEKRIDTTDLPGDWLHLAETVNDTLDTGEEHHVSAVEELHHRDALARISSDAALAETPSQLTTAVLKHLPRALPGSRSQLHRHPIGLPTLDLGVPLGSGISALELPATPERGEVVNLRDGDGIATLVEFADGPPAVLVLNFGNKIPTKIEGLISIVETAAQILAQGQRRYAAETQALYDRGHDVLTELPNSEFARIWFAEEADRSTRWSIVGVQPQNLEMVDGLMGRSSRDDLLRSIADALSEIVDDLNTSQDRHALLARVTTPDFIVVVPTAQRIALSELIAKRFGEPIVVDSQAIEIGATIAYNEVARSDRDLTETITDVSASISQADGRDIEIIPFEKTHRELLRRRGIIIDWLTRAIENQELSVHFQPIVHAVTTHTVGYEALVRATMDGDPVSPAEFIPIAEENGLISAIGDFVLREACAALPLLGTDPYVSVNLSPVELLDTDILERIDSTLEALAAPRDRIVFEVTEGATATPEGIERLYELRELGVKLAIDDFGSGQSNLSYLNDLPAEILKLDRALITPMTHDDNAATLVEKTIEMAHALDMTVVAEGVETAEELDALRRIYCDRIQGWHTGRPAPLENFIEVSIDDTVMVDDGMEVTDEAA